MSQPKIEWEFDQSVCSDWRYAFGSDGAAAPFTLADVAKVIACVRGDNDGPSWVGVFKMREARDDEQPQAWHDRYVALDAWCDYTGWGCQSGGNYTMHATCEEAFLMGLDDDDRIRLGVV